MVLIFLALLLECKIVLLSERLTQLTVCAEALRFLIQVNPTPTTTPT